MSDTLPGYDEIPYESFPITETHPDRLAVIGRLFGLACPDPARARVLELGCAAGGNLLPIAWYLPETHCVGLELSRTQALRGAALADALELRNAEIRHQDLMAFAPEGEPFDYIIAHGLFSWVPPAVQDHVLRICGSRLAPGGIAYISYNTLPGSRQRAMLRDMLLHHTRDLTVPRERLAAAREFLHFLATPLEQKPVGHDWLEHEIEYLRGARDSYLYHEYLEDRNQALLFSEFAARAARHGLQYLAESQLHTLFASTLGSGAEAALARFDNLPSEEQYADFLRLRPFRQTLLCRAAEPLSREIDLDAILSLPLYANLAQDPSREAFLHASTGQTFQVVNPWARALLSALREVYPGARTLEELLPYAVQHAGLATPAKPVDLGVLKQELFGLYISGGLQPSLCAPEPGPPRSADAQPGAGPCASRLARIYVANGELLVPTPRHQGLTLDQASARMLALLDGTRSLPALVDEVEAIAAREPEVGRILGSGRRERLRRQIGANLEGLLALLARHGILQR